LSESARRLGLSARTLQRRLAGEGASFEQLVDAVRSELAARYLEDRRLSLNDVAFLLGYSDVGAFHRAHKRWTGKTPRRARQSLSPGE
jgi:AraC-like DNA-binding protein